jgi:hypothetical protein
MMIYSNQSRTAQDFQKEQRLIFDRISSAQAKSWRDASLCRLLPIGSGVSPAGIQNYLAIDTKRFAGEMPALPVGHGWHFLFLLKSLQKLMFCPK